MNQYAKFLVQVVGAALTAIAAAMASDDVISVSEWTNIVITVLGAVSVLGAGNLPAGVWKYAKLYVSAATAGAVMLSSLTSGGVSTAEWLQVVVAALAAVGVGTVSGPLVVDTASARPRPTD